VWFHAIALILNAKKGISAKQLQRDLNIGGYKTAWYLNHRIREAMREGSLPQLGGTVEIDETYLGRKKGAGEGKSGKNAVLGMRERGGPLRFLHTKEVNSKTWKSVLAQNLSLDVEYVMSDESTWAKAALKGTGKHQIVNHSRKEYVRGNVHTNSIESAFSLLKRGVIGQFHMLSIKHLQRYLNEFSYRFNRRNNPDAFIETVRRLCGLPPLEFKVLTSEV
jgi:hypothetical protein